MQDKKTKISFIGTGSGIVMKGRYPSGVVLDDDILIDIPPQVHYSLKTMDISQENLKYAFITHFHPDHILGIVMMTQEWLVLKNRKFPLTLIGPIGLKNKIISLLNIFFKKYSPIYPEILKFYEIDIKKSIYNIDGVLFDAFPLKHNPESLGYKIYKNDFNISFSGDTGVCENLKYLLQSNVIVLEMTTIFESYDIHLNFIENLIPIYNKINSNQKLFLYHLAYTKDEIIKQLTDSKNKNSFEILDILKKDNVILTEDLKEYDIII